MKIVLLTNNSGPAKFIANHLYEKGLLDAAIIEDGTIKKKSKIFREIKSTPWARIPIKFLDLLAIYIYSQFAKSYIEKARRNQRIEEVKEFKSFLAKTPWYKFSKRRNIKRVIKSIEDDLNG